VFHVHQQDDSQEYQDACDLWEIYEEVKAELMEETFGSLDDVYGTEGGRSHAKKAAMMDEEEDSDATDIEDNSNVSSVASIKTSSVLNDQVWTIFFHPPFIHLLLSKSGQMLFVRFHP
jgi:hypothetical protein